VTLSNRRGGNGDNFINTVFDDEAALAIATGSAPFAGSFRPDSALSALDGQAINGTWQLKITDLAPSDLGSVTAFGLDITPPPSCDPVQTLPDLTVSKTHTGSFTVGHNGTYTLTVANTGAGATTGAITVTDTLPAGLTFVSGTGTGWTCAPPAGQVLTCTNPGPLATNASSVLTLTVGVSSGAVPSITNEVTVSTPGETNIGNNTASDPTTVSAPLGQPTTTSPSGAITDSTPTYTWNHLSDATGYDLTFVGRIGGAVQSSHTAATACSEATCSVTPSTELSGGTHAWVVRATNEAGPGPWSAAKFFFVGTAAPGQATLAGPSGTIDDSTPTFTWGAVAHAALYRLVVLNATGDVVLDRWSPDLFVCNATGCGVPQPAPLPAGGYFWVVRTWNPAGFGPWSAAGAFTVSATAAASRAAAPVDSQPEGDPTLRPPRDGPPPRVVPRAPATAPTPTPGATPIPSPSTMPTLVPSGATSTR
jgi:uncharacterized repeat protein (TIGR01451 family)